MNEISVIPFEAKHFEAVLSILYESNCLHAQNDPEQFICAPITNSIPYLQNFLDNPDNFGLIAVDDKDQVLGIVLAGYLLRDENVYQNHRFCQIFDIVVGANFKKRGIGRLLIEKTRDKAADDGISQIELEVFSFNCNAVAFYQKMGFREVSRNMTLLF